LGRMRNSNSKTRLERPGHDEAHPYRDHRLDDVPGDGEPLQPETPAVQFLLASRGQDGHGESCGLLLAASASALGAEQPEAVEGDGYGGAHVGEHR
jgi:hypothetical protein